MVQFLAVGTVLDSLKLLLTFVLLTALPLLLIMLIKRARWQDPLLQHFNHCIRHGRAFAERDCHLVGTYLQEIENCFALLKGKDLEPSQEAVSLNIALKALPLLHKMAQADTCCAEDSANMPPFNRAFACKQKMEELLNQWAQDEQLPLVPKQIAHIKEVARKIERNKGHYQLKLIALILAFLVSSFLITNVIILEMPSWEPKMAAYLSFLLLFAFSYDYQYSERFKRYEGSWLKHLFKKNK